MHNVKQSIVHFEEWFQCLFRDIDYTQYVHIKQVEPNHNFVVQVATRIFAKLRASVNLRRSSARRGMPIIGYVISRAGDIYRYRDITLYSKARYCIAIRFSKTDFSWYFSKLNKAIFHFYTLQSLPYCEYHVYYYLYILELSECIQHIFINLTYFFYCWVLQYFHYCKCQYGTVMVPGQSGNTRKDHS